MKASETKTASSFQLHVLYDYPAWQNGSSTNKFIFALLESYPPPPKKMNMICYTHTRERERLRLELHSYTLDFSHFGPFKKLISLIDPWKNLSQKWSFWGARVAGTVIQWDGASLSGAVLLPPWHTRTDVAGGGRQHGWRRPPNPSPLSLFLCMELQRCHFCFIFSDVFSHLGSRYNQPLSLLYTFTKIRP